MKEPNNQCISSSVSGSGVIQEKKIPLNCTKNPDNSRWYLQKGTRFYNKGPSELIVLCEVQAGLNEDTLHCLPVIVLIWRMHAMDFPLASDWVTILLACYWKECICSYVLETHCIIPAPVTSTALHCPHIQVISFTIITKGAYFLLGKREALQYTCIYQESMLSARIIVLEGKILKNDNIFTLR